MGVFSSIRITLNSSDYLFPAVERVVSESWKIASPCFEIEDAQGGDWQQVVIESAEWANVIIALDGNVPKEFRVLLPVESTLQSAYCWLSFKDRVITFDPNDGPHLSGYYRYPDYTWFLNTILIPILDANIPVFSVECSTSY